MHTRCLEHKYWLMLYSLVLGPQGYLGFMDCEQKRDPYPQGLHIAPPDKLLTCDAWHTLWRCPPGETQPRGQACAWPSGLRASRLPAEGKGSDGPCLLRPCDLPGVPTSAEAASIGAREILPPNALSGAQPLIDPMGTALLRAQVTCLNYETKEGTYYA